MGNRDGRGGGLSTHVPGRIDSEVVYQGRVVRLSRDAGVTNDSPHTFICTTPGFTDEVIRLFIATNLEPGELSRDPGRIHRSGESLLF